MRHIHARIKADGSHAVVELDVDGAPVIGADGANLIEDDGSTAWFGWEDFELVAQPQREVLRHITAFINGMREFRLSLTMHYDGTLATAYDRGRDFAHRITLRKFEV